jgi:hypothetical protein
MSHLKKNVAIYTYLKFGLPLLDRFQSTISFVRSHCRFIGPYFVSHHVYHRILILQFLPRSSRPRGFVISIDFTHYVWHQKNAH